MLVQLLYIFISSVSGFLFGILLTVTRLNHAGDIAARRQIVDLIDEVIECFHARYTNEPAEQMMAAMRFDYQIRGLIDNTTLIPIIGKRCFEEEYTTQIGELFKASSQEPRELDSDELKSLFKHVNALAVGIKKTINIDRGNFRFKRRS